MKVRYFLITLLVIVGFAFAQGSSNDNGNATIERRGGGVPAFGAVIPSSSDATIERRGGGLDAFG